MVTVLRNYFYKVTYFSFAWWHHSPLLTSASLRIACFWTRWRSIRRRAPPSLLRQPRTTRPLFLPSRLLEPRQMAAGRLAVRRTSTRLTAPRTSQCCPSPRQASWQQVRLFLPRAAFRADSFCFNSWSRGRNIWRCRRWFLNVATHSSRALNDLVWWEQMLPTGQLEGKMNICVSLYSTATGHFSEMIQQLSSFFLV